MKLRWKKAPQGDLNDENEFERFPRPIPSLFWSKTQSKVTSLVKLGSQFISMFITYHNTIGMNITSPLI